MSGGHFDYDEHRCADMATSILEWVDDNQHWLSPEAMARLRLAADTLTLAGTMAHRVDWFISCDDGEDSFLERWDEDGLPTP